jgi:uncharacterized protein YciW
MSTDLIDNLLGLAAPAPLHSVRHARDKVLAATQGSHELFFAEDLPGDLTLVERLAVALYAASLTPQTALAEHYLQQLQDRGVAPHVLATIQNDSLQDLAEPRLRAILGFTRTLILAPVEGDQSALKLLQDAGLATTEIVVLAQLIAYLSYQTRLLAGLSALQGTQS